MWKLLEMICIFFVSLNCMAEGPAILIIGRDNKKEAFVNQVEDIIHSVKSYHGESQTLVIGDGKTGIDLNTITNEIQKFNSIGSPHPVSVYVLAHGSLTGKNKNVHSLIFDEGDSDYIDRGNGELFFIENRKRIEVKTKEFYEMLSNHLSSSNVFMNSCHSGASSKDINRTLNKNMKVLTLSGAEELSMQNSLNFFSSLKTLESSNATIEEKLINFLSKKVIHNKNSPEILNFYNKGRRGSFSLENYYLYMLGKPIDKNSMDRVYSTLENFIEPKRLDAVMEELRSPPIEMDLYDENYSIRLAISFSLSGGWEPGTKEADQIRDSHLKYTYKNSIKYRLPFSTNFISNLGPGDKVEMSETDGKGNTTQSTYRVHKIIKRDEAILRLPVTSDEGFETWKYKKIIYDLKKKELVSFESVPAPKWDTREFLPKKKTAMKTCGAIIKSLF